MTAQQLLKLLHEILKLLEMYSEDEEEYDCVLDGDPNIHSHVESTPSKLGTISQLFGLNGPFRFDRSNLALVVQHALVFRPYVSHISRATRIAVAKAMVLINQEFTAFAIKHGVLSFSHKRVTVGDDLLPPLQDINGPAFNSKRVTYREAQTRARAHERGVRAAMVQLNSTRAGRAWLRKKDSASRFLSEQAAPMYEEVVQQDLQPAVGASDSSQCSDSDTFEQLDPSHLWQRSRRRAMSSTPSAHSGACSCVPWCTDLLDEGVVCNVCPTKLWFPHSQTTIVIHRAAIKGSNLDSIRCQLLRVMCAASLSPSDASAPGLGEDPDWCLFTKNVLDPNSQTMYDNVLCWYTECFYPRAVARLTSVPAQVRKMAVQAYRRYLPRDAQEVLDHATFSVQTNLLPATLRNLAIACLAATDFACATTRSAIVHAAGELSTAGLALRGVIEDADPDKLLAGVLASYDTLNKLLVGAVGNDYSDERVLSSPIDEEFDVAKHIKVVQQIRARLYSSVVVL